MPWTMDWGQQLLGQLSLINRLTGHRIEHQAQVGAARLISDVSRPGSSRGLTSVVVPPCPFGQAGPHTPFFGQSPPTERTRANWPAAGRTLTIRRMMAVCHPPR